MYEFNFNFDDYNIQYVEPASRWYSHIPVIGLELNFPHDSKGVRLFYYNNNYYYHPYMLGSMGLRYLMGYLQSPDEEYRVLIYNYIERISEIGTRIDSSIYVPYMFNYGLHANSQNEIMVAPWYSGISQGMILSFLSRTAEVFDDQSLRPIADSIFNSFLDFTGDGDIWITAVDSLNYYWIEEYPFNPRTQVLNGFIIAVLGLGDYYLLTYKPECKILIQAGCTTFNRYFDEYRVPGEPSYYCLLHKIAFTDYHAIHISLFRDLASLTNAANFDAFADTLQSDYSP